jgi:hypothetical protein
VGFQVGTKASTPEILRFLIKTTIRLGRANRYIVNKAAHQDSCLMAYIFI